MCEYQIVEENKPPMCEHTKNLCTCCILGNQKTYEKAKKADNITDRVASSTNKALGIHSPSRVIREMLRTDKESDTE